MTTEIELYKIGETYIKFDFEYSESNKSKIKEAYLAQIRLISREYLKEEQVYKISIEFEAGSLKSRIIVWGTVVYMGIGNYGSFRAGVKQIINDVRQFSEVVINNMDNDPNIAESDIIRTQKRLGFPGRLQELYIRIDAYERSINNLWKVKHEAELNAIRLEIASLIELLSEPDKQAFLKDLNSIYTHNLPQPNQRRATYLINRYGLKPDEEIEYIEE